MAVYCVSSHLFTHFPFLLLNIIIDHFLAVTSIYSQVVLYFTCLVFQVELVSSSYEVLSTTGVHYTSKIQLPMAEVSEGCPSMPDGSGSDEDGIGSMLAPKKLKRSKW